MSLRAKLASQSAIIFGMRIVGAGLVFLAQAAIARFWGKATLGDYLLIMATVNVTAMAMPLGFQTVGTYFAAEYRARGQGHLLRRFALRTYMQAGLVALLALLVVGFVSRFASFSDDLFAQNWLPAAILTIATAVVFINSALLVGLERPFTGFFADGLFRPVLLIGAFAIGLIFTGGTSDLTWLLWIMALGYSMISLAHMFFTIYVIGRVQVGLEPGIGEAHRWWRFALPWVLISLATDFFFDIDLLSLAGLLSREELAVFGVCTRIFTLAAFGAAAVYAVNLPAIFEAEANENRAGFMRKIGDANLVATGVSAILFVCVGLFGPFALLLFGSGFSVGAGPLAVLCLALVVRSAFGPASLVLSIHDRPYASLPGIALGIGTLLLANWLLVPQFGLMGAAVAALIAITIWSAALWVTARKIAGIDVSILPRFVAWQKAKAGISHAPSV